MGTLVNCHRLIAIFLLTHTVVCGAAETLPEVILGDLDNPCGVAVQPGTGHVFVSESGRGRVIRVVDDKVQEVVVGFQMGRFGAELDFRVGPLGLAFLNSDILAIGGGGKAQGEELVHVVQVPPAGGKPIQAEASMKFGPLKAGARYSGGGNFCSLVATNEAVFVTSQGDDHQGWIAAIPIRKLDKLHLAGAYGHLTRFLATQPLTGIEAPRGLAISPRGELLVAQMGEMNDQVDSRLAFYRLGDGKLLMNLATGLHDLVAVAYGAPHAPSDKPLLYALDLAWRSPDKGGLYRLDASLKGGSPDLHATRISPLDRPTAMALGPDGSLHVTVLGAPKPKDGSHPGQLVRFLPGL